MLKFTDYLEVQVLCILFQLSFILQSLRNPDVFCFADYPCHTVVVDILKAAPDDENRDIATWYVLLKSNCA